MMRVKIENVTMSLQVLLHDLRKLEKPLYRFAHHSDEVLQVRFCPGQGMAGF